MRNSERGQFEHVQYARDVLAYTFPKPSHVLEENREIYRGQLKEFVKFKINFIEGADPILTRGLVDRLVVLKVRELERIGDHESTNPVRKAFPLLKY